MYFNTFCSFLHLCNIKIYLFSTWIRKYCFQQIYRILHIIYDNSPQMYLLTKMGLNCSLICLSINLSICFILNTQLLTHYSSVWLNSISFASRFDSEVSSFGPFRKTFYCAHDAKHSLAKLFIKLDFRTWRFYTKSSLITSLC